MKNMIDMWRSERSNPWREFSALQRQMDRLLNEFGNSSQMIELQNDVDFVPRCDFEETGNHYLITLDVPGVNKDQLNVEISGNTLTISGEQKEEKTEGKGARRTYERYHGRFERSFTLPDIAASEKVEADYKDGVLRIAVPKSEEVKAKTQKIQIGEGKSGLFTKPQLRTGEKKPGEKAA